MGGAELFRELNAQVGERRSVCCLSLRSWKLATLQADKDTLQDEKDDLTNRMFQDLETAGTEKDALLAEKNLLLSTVGGSVSSRCRSRLTISR